METEEGKVLISVSEELAEHFAVTKRLRDEAVADVETTFSQKSTVIRAVTSIIGDLAKMQTDLYSSSLVAKLQQACYNALREVDPVLYNKVMEAMEGQFNENS